MLTAYTRLHHAGLAHSIEVREGGELVGGLYGVAIGRIFCGESMFSRRPDASKVALVYLTRQLQRWGFPLIDTQLPSEHLYSLGAEAVPRAKFVEMLKSLRDAESRIGPWRLDPDLVDDLTGLTEA
jgi:leucyl/phenylalanyl-tRNA--protein transferase